MRRAPLAAALLALVATAAWPAPADAVRAGAIDSRFASCGQATSHVPRSIAGRQFDYRAGAALAAQPDGRIVAGGPAARGMGATRFNPDGSLDTSFGGDGMAFVPRTGEGAGDPTFVNDVAVQADGKVVVAGFRRTGTIDPAGGLAMRFLVARFLPGGEPDTSFGGDGLVEELPPGAGTTAAASDVAPAGDGSLIVVGNVDNRFALVRLRADGGFDETFGEGGVARVTTPGRPEGWGGAAFVRPDGRIVAAGYTDATNDGAFTVARLTANGAPDPAFAGGGAVAEPFDEHSLVSALVPLPDGRFYAIGASWDEWGDRYDPVNNARAAIVRYLEDGRRDTSFAGDGSVLDGLGEGLYGQAAAGDGAVDADGRLTIAAPPGRLARYTSAGARDTAFGIDGVLRLFGAPTGDALIGLPDGGLVLGGQTRRQERSPRGFEAGAAIMRLAGSGPALAAVENQPAACFLRLRNPTLAHLLRRGRVARNGRALVGFYLTQPGNGSVSAVLETGPDITIGDAAFVSNSAGSRSVELRVRAAAAKRLRRLRTARIRVYLTLEEGVVQPVSVPVTLRR